MLESAHCSEKDCLATPDTTALNSSERREIGTARGGEGSQVQPVEL